MVDLASSVVSLEMKNIKGLTKLHREDLMHLGAVEDLYIESCDELRYLWEQDLEACKSLVRLQKLSVRYCKKFISFAEKEVKTGSSVESLKLVTFLDCETLKSYDCPNSVESLKITLCDSMTFLTFSSSLNESLISGSNNLQPIPAKGPGSLQMSCLTELQIINCKNLKSVSHEHFQNLTSLKEMQILNCPSMDYSFPCGLWPPNISKLEIGGLSKPMSEWGLQNFPTSLLELKLHGGNSGVVSFAVAGQLKNTTTPSSCFILPQSLVSLTLQEFMDVESFSEVLQHLPCLKTLQIRYCLNMRDLKTNSGTSNLTIEVVGY